MNLKDLKDRLVHAVETENPRGTGYYGAEADEAELEADRERMEHANPTHHEAPIDEAPMDFETPTTPGKTP